MAKQSKDPSDLTPVVDEPNPYAPPKSLATEPQAPESREAPDNVSYHRPLMRRKASMALMGIEGIVVVLGLFSAYTSGFTSQMELQSVDILRILISMAAFIVFLTWFFRKYKNLYVLGREHMRCTPGWAVGYWFIPFLNLVRPVQCIYDIWRAGAVEGEAPTNNPLFGWWWAAWICSAVLGQFAASGGRIVIASNVFDLVLIGLTILVIQTLGARQDQKAHSMGLLK